MRIRHRGGEDSNLIFRRKVVLHSGVRLGRVGCSQQGICRGDRALIPGDNGEVPHYG